MGITALKKSGLKVKSIQEFHSEMAVPPERGQSGG
jgi:hypothetical protein